jgi:predicted HAD superfamily Cof-like phosphohydrolase
MDNERRNSTILPPKPIAQGVVHTHFDDVEHFHRHFMIAYRGKPRALPDNMRGFRVERLQEEVDEYKLAMDLLDRAVEQQDRASIEVALEQALDALVDTVYIALGNAHLHGFDFNEAFARVHRANLAKVRAEGDYLYLSKYNNSADIVKPPGWEPPSHADLVADHAYPNAR